ncbi:hypothetical protein OHR68_09140 [Spirillospora sp. NBC_00431]
MNLSDAKHGYRRVLAEVAALAASGEVSEDRLADARRRLDAVRKSAMRQIDLYTTRPHNSVNSRRGLTIKLEQLHEQAHAELRAIVPGR